MQSQTFRTRSEEETIELGRRIAPELAGVVLLIGDLGAGKTTLAKGIVEGRGAARAEDVSSPTFTLIHQYGDSAGEIVYHADLYRLERAREAENIGLGDLFASGTLVLVEWAERFPSLLLAQRTEIRLRRENDDSRNIVISKPV